METPKIAMINTFQLFPTLPKELRLAIWQLALFQPRTVIIRRRSYITRTIPPAPPNLVSNTLYYQSYTPPPILTQINSESRLEALNFYTPAFTQGSKSRYTYINFAIDTVVMPDFDFFSGPYDPSPEREKMQNLALTIEEWEWFHDTYLKASKGPRILAGVRGLKEFTGICANLGEGGYRDSAKDLVEEMKKCLEDVMRLDRCLDGWVCPRIRFVGSEEEGELKGVEIKREFGM